jgi:hypothetical protein
MKTVLNIFAVAIVLAGSGIVSWRPGSGVGPNAEALLAAAPLGEERKDNAHEVLSLWGGALIDPVEKVIFVANAGGVIEAIDIATGNTLWQTQKKHGMRWPVAVHGRTLVVRERDKPLRIAGLDLDANGKTLWTTEPVLPEWVKGPKWLEDWPSREREGREREVRERLPERQRDKPEPELKELQLAALEKLKMGTYRCEERIEKGEFVMRWQAANALAEPSSGVVVVDLKTGKFRTRPLEKDRQIEEKVPPGTVEYNGTVFGVAETLDVGDWVKTLPASRSIVEARMLTAVDKKTNKVLWEHILRMRSYKEIRSVNGEKLHEFTIPKGQAPNRR